MPGEIQDGQGNTTPAANQDGAAAPASAPATAPAPEANAPAAAPAPAAKAVAPEKYEFKMPEGVQLDEEGAAEFSKIAKEHGLTQEQADKFVGLYAARAQAQAQTHAALVESWAEQVRTDKEIGGDKLAENLAVAAKAVELGGPEVKALLDSTGLGNHPAFVKWAVSVGKALSEDKFVRGAPSANPMDPAKSLFPSMN